MLQFERQLTVKNKMLECSIFFRRDIKHLEITNPSTTVLRLTDLLVPLPLSLRAYA